MTTSLDCCPGIVDRFSQVCSVECNHCNILSGTAVKQDQKEQRKKLKERLVTDGVYYPQPPPPRRPKSAYAALGE